VAIDTSIATRFAFFAVEELLVRVVMSTKPRRSSAVLSSHFRHSKTMLDGRQGSA